MIRRGKAKGQAVKIMPTSKEAVENAIDLSKEEGTTWEGLLRTVETHRKPSKQQSPRCPEYK